MKIASARPRGRPRTFNRDEALDRAVTTFWAKGYSGASLDDLTESMGINRPSLYSAFGNKHDLFIKAIDRYGATFGRKPIDALLKEPNIERAVEAFFEATIRCVSSRENPNGCLIMSVAGEYAENDKKIRAKMARAYADKVNVVSERVKTAQEEGQIPPDADPEGIARMIISIMQSLAARARVGASRKELAGLAQNFTKLLFPAST